MDCNLLQLPAELLRMIFKELRSDDVIEDYMEPDLVDHPLINWSCTCSYFRNLLAPNIFKSVKLVNSEKSGSSLDTVAQSQHNVHVKELHFISGVLAEEAAFSDAEGIFPGCVDGLVSDLQRFPNLQRLSLKFSHEARHRDNTAWAAHTFTEEETPEQVLEAEASVAWRALTSRTYSALAQNKSLRLKHLEIRNFIWKGVSTYDHAAFHNFLSHIEQFTFSTHLPESLVGWKLDRSLMEKLDKYFFNHLTNVTTLSIKNLNLHEHEEYTWLSGKIYAPLPLKVDQMPLLTTLHLDYIFISTELTDFLVGHKDTLEELILQDCYASTGDRTAFDNGIHWSQLFTSLFSACPPQLHRLELVFSSADSFTLEDTRGEEGFEDVLSILEQDPRRILFPYAEMRGCDWLLCYEWEQCFTAYSNGEDQRSWDRLAGLVEGNAKKAGKSESKGVKVVISVLRVGNHTGVLYI